jgi:hypothetical protein
LEAKVHMLIEMVHSFQQQEKMKKSKRIYIYFSYQ